MAIQGVFASDQSITGNRPGDFASGLLQTMPEGSARLLALSAGMESAEAHDPIINWFEEDHLSGRTAISSFTTNGDGTGIVVPDASFYPAGTVMLNEDTGEYVLVTACNTSTNTLTVTRNMDGQGAVTMTTAHHLQRIGTAFEEGSAKPTAVVNLGRVRTNYCQIFRNVWSVTGTAKATEYYTGSVIAKNRADCALFHSEDIERALWWGSKTIGTLNSKPFRTMDGLYNQITTNIEVADATTTYNQLDDFFREIFSINIKGKPNERIAYGGNKVLSVLNRIAINSAQMTITPQTAAFGLAVNRWITPYGNLTLMTHPLFTESPHFTGDLVILHPGAIRVRWLRRTMIKDHLENESNTNGDDMDYGVYTSELSCELRAEKTAGIYKAMQDAA